MHLMQISNTLSFFFLPFLLCKFHFEAINELTNERTMKIRGKDCENPVNLVLLIPCFFYSETENKVLNLSFPDFLFPDSTDFLQYFFLGLFLDFLLIILIIKITMLK